MKKKYITIRCGKNTPTPYLKKNVNLFMTNNFQNKKIVDIGCGNGRNINFLLSQGFKYYKAFDLQNDFGEKIILGTDKLPIKNNSTDIILANYVLMFLNKKDIQQVIMEIKRIAKKNCHLMVELYSAKNSYIKTKTDSLKLQEEIFKTLNWKKVKYSQERFIVSNIY